jgi:hypothetical protein
MPEGLCKTCTKRREARVRMQRGGAAYRTSVKETFTEREMDVSSASTDVRLFLRSNERFIAETLRASISLNSYACIRFSFLKICVKQIKRTELHIAAIALNHYSIDS